MTSAHAALAACELFAALDESAIAQIVPRMERTALLGGQVLFREGDVGDCLYVVTYGRLRATKHHNGAETLLGEVGSGETVGEMALLTGEPRSATVRAARDSELYRLSADAFTALIDQHPRVTMQLARRIVTRYAKVIRTRGPALAPSTIALIPAGPDVPVARFSERLGHALERAGTTFQANSGIVDAALGAGASQLPLDDPHAHQVLAWLTGQEARSRFMLYVADPQLNDWTRRSVRQADRILVVANGDESPGPSLALVQELLTAGGAAPVARIELVLLHRARKPVYSGTSQWLAMKPAASLHHHVAIDSAEDVDRVARFLTGRTVGVVLGGGGARGFAHIGALRAIAEAGLPVDAVGGASMGAYIAAQCALGWDPDRMRDYNRAIWLRHKPMKDYTLPVVSLLSGRGFREVARDFCGDVCIEDLALPFYCVSSNLSRAQVNVHRRGPLCAGILPSISVPGLLPPVPYAGDLLVDGAILDNVPVDVMQQIGAATIIASDVSPAVDLVTDPDANAPASAWQMVSKLRRGASNGPRTAYTIVDVLMRVSMLSSTIAAQTTKQQATVYLNLPVAPFTVVDWTRVEQLIDAGYTYARDALAKARETGALPIDIT
jgi:NTE family protein